MEAVAQFDDWPRNSKAVLEPAAVGVASSIEIPKDIKEDKVVTARNTTASSTTLIHRIYYFNSFSNPERREFMQG
jgi:hypothetical protein